MAHDNGAAARHRLGDHHPEWFRRGAGVNDDVEGAKRGLRLHDESGDADAIGDAGRLRQVFQLASRVLAAVGLIDGAADDVRAHGEVRRQLRDRLDERGVSLPAGVRRDETDANRAGRGRRQAGESIEIRDRAVRREALQVDRVVNRHDVHIVPEYCAHIVGDTARVRDNRRAAGHIPPKQARGNRPRPDVIVHVPHERRRVGRAGGEHVHLQTVRVDDIGTKRGERAAQLCGVGSDWSGGKAELRGEACITTARRRRRALAEPGDRWRKRRADRRHAQRLGARRQRSVRCDHELQPPRRPRGAQARERVEQARLGAAELPARAEKTDSHQAADA